MGNGYGLGLTSGDNNGVLGRVATSSTTAALVAGNLDGRRLPETNIGNYLESTIGYTFQVGIATDPEKSGITLEKEPWIVFIAY